MKRLGLLGLITLISLMLALFPGGQLLTWPIQLFVTYVHELMHALAAVYTGGQAHLIEIHPDTSGITMTSGGSELIINMAGYLGAVIVGTTSLLALSKGVSARIILLGFVIMIMLTIFYTGFHDLFGTSVGIVMIVMLLVVMKFTVSAEIIAAFMSLQILLNAFYDLNTLVFLSATSSTHTDAMNMQAATGIPAIFWAVFWLGISVISVAYVFLSQLRKS